MPALRIFPDRSLASQMKCYFNPKEEKMSTGTVSGGCGRDADARLTDEGRRMR